MEETLAECNFATVTAFNRSAAIIIIIIHYRKQLSPKKAIIASLQEMKLYTTNLVFKRTFYRHTFYLVEHFT